MVEHFKRYLNLHANKKENEILTIWNCVKEKDLLLKVCLKVTSRRDERQYS